jgi:hypothetical protein
MFLSEDVSQGPINELLSLMDRAGSWLELLTRSNTNRRSCPLCVSALVFRPILYPGPQQLPCTVDVNGEQDDPHQGTEVS